MSGSHQASALLPLLKCPPLSRLQVSLSFLPFFTKNIHLSFTPSFRGPSYFLSSSSLPPQLQLVWFLALHQTVVSRPGIRPTTARDHGETGPERNRQKSDRFTEEQRLFELMNVLTSSSNGFTALSGKTIW